MLIKDFIPANKFKFVEHEIADISIIEIFPNQKIKKEELLDIALPIRMIVNNTETLPLSYDVTMIGYPHASLFLSKIQSDLSAILIDSRTASKKVKSISSLNNKPCEFIFLSNPSIQGMSGGPVFTSLQRTMTIGDASYYIGIIHGTNFDNTGGKLAMITPSNYVFEILEKIK